jgi:hypothetical protein
MQNRRLIGSAFAGCAMLIAALVSQGVAAQETKATVWRLVERDGLWGIADADGTDVIAARYRALDCFRNGVAFAAIDSRRQWCALGPDDLLRDKPCLTNYYPHIPTHSAPETFDKEPFENSVLWARAYLAFAAGHRDTPPRWIHVGR